MASQLLTFLAQYEATDRFRKFQDWGDFTLAYSTLQAGLKYFETEDGYLAYDTKWGINFVLADPVAPPSEHGALLDAYLNRFPNSYFCEISRSTAENLSDRGFYVNESSNKRT